MVSIIKLNAVSQIVSQASIKSALLLLMATSLFSPVQAEENLWISLTSGKVDISLRYRFEYADDSRVPLKEAYASTLRSAFGYRTADFYDTSLYFQIQDVRVVGDDAWYNDGSDNNPLRSVIADAESTEIQQYYLRFGGLSKSIITLGRQQFNHRPATQQRFLGDISFRQHQQSLDAARLLSLAVPHTVIDYSYIWNVNRIFGENNPLPDADDFRSNSHALNIQYNAWPGIKLEGYLYLLEFTSSTARRFSTATSGLRLQGDKVIAQNLRLNYAAEFAHQLDYSNNPNAISANYALAELGASYNIGLVLDNVSFKYSYERLEGDGGVSAFQTPLGTNHAFQGFADRFLVTPGDGIQDHFITLSGKLSGIQLSAVYHHFLSDQDNYDYGHEWDFLAERSFGQHFIAGIKYAGYFADPNRLNLTRNDKTGQAADLVRFWAYLQFSY